VERGERSTTTLTKEECEDIQRPVVNAILPKMGIARSAPRKVVFGTKSDSPSDNAGQQQTTIFAWPFEVWRHNRRAHANNVRIHATGMRVQR
jgi:hypothetical protein